MRRSALSPPPKTAALGFALLILLSAGPAASFDLGARLGYGRGPDGDTAEPSAGIYTRFDIPGPVNLELAGDYWKEDLPGGMGSVDVLPLQATALLYFLPLPVVKPYLLGGAGVFMLNLTEEGPGGAGREESEQLFSLHGGAGIDLPLLGLAGLTADLRYYAAGETTLAGGETYRPGGWRAYLGIHLRF
jgi:hypothetical protein